MEPAFRRAQRLSAFLLAAMLVVAALLVRRLELADAGPLDALPDPTIESGLLAGTLRRFDLDRLVMAAVRFPGGVFTARALGELEAAGKELRDLPGVTEVQSIVETSDLRPSPDGLEAVDLATTYGRDEAGLAELRAHVLAHPLMSGGLVSPDGGAALLLVRLGGAPGPGDAGVAASVEEVVRRRLTEAEIEMGGQPWIAGRFAGAARADAPVIGAGLVLGALGALLALALRRGPRGAALAVAGALAMLLAGAGARGMSDRDVGPLELLAPLGLVLVAIVFGVLLAARPGDPLPAGAAVAALGACVAIAFLARVPGPDVSKLRIAAGAACGAALLATVARRSVAWGIRRPDARELVAAVLIAAAIALRLERLPAGALPELPGDPGPRVLAEAFGQEAVMLVRVHGDVTDPVVVDRIGELEDDLARVPGVARVTGLASVVRFLGSLLGDGWRVPLSPGKLGNVYFFFEGTRESRLLVSHDNQEALVTVALAPGFTPATVAACRTLAGAVEPVPYVTADATEDAPLRTLRRDDLVRRLGRILGKDEASLRAGMEAAARDVVGGNLDPELAAELEGLGLDAQAARRIVQSADPLAAVGAEVSEPELAAEVEELVAAGLGRARMDAEARLASDLLGAADERARARVQAAYLGLGDALVVRRGGAPAGPEPPVATSAIRAYATGEPSLEGVVGAELQRIVVHEGLLELLLLLAAGIVSGSGLALLPAAAYLGWRTATGPSLADAVLLPLPACLGVVLLLGSGGGLRRTEAVAAGLLAAAVLAASAVVATPLLGEALAGAGVALLGAAAAFASVRPAPSRP